MPRILFAGRRPKDDLGKDLLTELSQKTEVDITSCRNCEKFWELMNDNPPSFDLALIGIRIRPDRALRTSCVEVAQKLLQDGVPVYFLSDGGTRLATDQHVARLVGVDLRMTPHTIIKLRGIINDLLPSSFTPERQRS